MDDDDIGWGKPPKSTRWKPEQSGNPNGRPLKPRPSNVGEVVRRVIDRSIEYDEKGKRKKSTGQEVRLRLHINRAVAGDVAAAELIFKKRAQAARNARRGAKRLLVRDWLPDYDGQTAEQKMEDVRNERPKDPLQKPDDD